MAAVPLGGAGAEGDWDIYLVGGHAVVPCPRVQVLTLRAEGGRVGACTHATRRGAQRRVDFSGEVGTRLVGQSAGEERERLPWEVGMWREGSSLTEPRTHHCCAVVDGLVLAIGGTNGDRVLRSVECFDSAHPDAGWVPLRPLHHARQGAAAVVLDGAVYVIGGHDGKRHLVSTPKHSRYSL